MAKAPFIEDHPLTHLLKAAEVSRRFPARLARKHINLKHIKVRWAMKTVGAARSLIDADPVRLGAMTARVFR